MSLLAKNIFSTPLTQFYKVVSIHRCYKKSSAFLCTKTPNSEVNSGKCSFDEAILDVLACPLSKKPLRYDAEKQELVCDDIGVAYPIVDGIPNLNPHDGRLLNKS